jgi:hypothetical protein
MMLKRLRGWVKFRTTAIPPKTLDEAQHAAQEQREVKSGSFSDAGRAKLQELSTLRIDASQTWQADETRCTTVQ